MKRQRFGVEVELDGLSVDAAARVVRDYLGGEYDHFGREWKVAEEPSVAHGFELITPPIFYSDISILQEIFRRLRQAGAHRSPTAGVHVHVGAEDFSLIQIRSLVNLYVSNSELFLRLVNVNPARRLHYSQSILRFAQEVDRRDPQTSDELKTIWYEVADSVHEKVTKYNTSRYTELNLNSYFFRGTLEFRIFNSTNHAGRLRAYVILILALVDFAKSYYGLYPLSEARIFDEETAVAASRRLFAMLGLEGGEYRTIRESLATNVSAYYSRNREPTRRSVTFESMGMIFDGSSHAEVLDEMMDNRYFDSAPIQRLLNQIRKRKPTALKYSIFRHISPRKAYEEYARALLLILVDEQLGRLAAIN